MIDEEAEVVDGLPVVADPSDVQEQAPASGAVVVPARQAAALAATGFVAGVTTAAVVRRGRARRAARKKKRTSAIGEIVSSNSFLIDVHLLRRD